MTCSGAPLYRGVPHAREWLLPRRQRTIAGGTVVEGQPKTPSGARTVALDAGTVRALRVWRKSHTEDRLAAGASWIDSGLVFTHPHGAGLWPQNGDRFLP